MRILEVIPALNSGGAERFVVDLCNQMVKDGHEVTLLTMKDSSINNFVFYKDELNDNVRQLNLGMGKFGLGTFYKLYKGIKSQKCDVVHFHLTATYFGFLALFFDGRKKYFVTSHTQAEMERDKSRFRFSVKKICLQLKLLYQVAISHQNARSVEKVFGVPPIKLIYNGRTCPSITDKYNDVRNEIEQYKSHPTTNVFTMIARCNPTKNIHRLVKCFNKLINSGEDVVLLVIGNGYDSPDIQPTIKQANKHIHFLGQRHNVVDYLSCSDFFTLSSDYEGMPITLIEALACGCIPVGTPVSGFNDIIVDGKNGFVAEAISDEAYLNALKRAISKKKDISTDSLKVFYKEKLSMEICARKYEELFLAFLKPQDSPTNICTSNMKL